MQNLFMNEWKIIGLIMPLNLESHVRVSLCKLMAEESLLKITGMGCPVSSTKYEIYKMKEKESALYTDAKYISMHLVSTFDGRVPL